MRRRRHLSEKESLNNPNFKGVEFDGFKIYLESKKRMKTKVRLADFYLQVFFVALIRYYFGTEFSRFPFKFIQNTQESKQDNKQDKSFK